MPLKALIVVLLSASGLITAQSAPPKPDELKRTTPRSSVYSFLEACHDEKFVLASRYLDLHGIAANQRSTKGPELAKQLETLLDSNPQFEVQKLSDRPEGNMEDGLGPGRDRLITLQSDETPMTLDLQRVTRQDESVWLVSEQSVELIPNLSALAGESAIEKRLPAVLVQTHFLGAPLWSWIAMVLLALILAVVSRFFSRLVLKIVKPLTKRYAGALHTRRIETLVEPLRLLLAVSVFRGALEFMSTSALLRDYLLKLLVLLFTLGVAALVMRIVDLIADQIISRLSTHQRALSYSVLPLGIRFAKICIFCLAVLSVLTAWGYNTTTILAGLGVGGLAVALAAQKTIENLFGGVSVITDRPVLVGDFCKFGGQVGTVEDIGLRSTRIRTLDRTVVTVPNSSFATMTLENFSRRDRMWFHPTLQLRRDSDPTQVADMMDALQKILEEHPMVDAGGVPLRFTQINDQSLQLEIFAYVQTADFNEYLKVQSELLLRFLNASSERGVGFAVPLVESFYVTDQAAPGRQTPVGPKAAPGSGPALAPREVPLQQG